MSAINHSQLPKLWPVAILEFGKPPSLHWNIWIQPSLNCSCSLQKINCNNLLATRLSWIKFTAETETQNYSHLKMAKLEMVSHFFSELGLLFHCLCLQIQNDTKLIIRHCSGFIGLRKFVWTFFGWWFKELTIPLCISRFNASTCSSFCLSRTCCISCLIVE